MSENSLAVFYQLSIKHEFRLRSSTASSLSLIFSTLSSGAHSHRFSLLFPNFVAVWSNQENNDPFWSMELSEFSSKSSKCWKACESMIMFFYIYDSGSYRLNTDVFKTRSRIKISLRYINTAEIVLKIRSTLSEFHYWRIFYKITGQFISSPNILSS